MQEMRDTYPRVSEILGTLKDWKHIDKEVLENKKQIGTDVHDAIKAELVNEYFPMLEDRRICYFESYKMWANEVKQDYKIIEVRFYDDDLQLRGQVDGVLETPNGLMLIDFKTSASEYFTRDGRSIWKMQAHLYWHLLKVNCIDIGPTMKFVQLRTEKIKHPDLGYNMLVPKAPKVFTYKYEPEFMQMCIDEVHRYHDDKSNAKCVD